MGASPGHVNGHRSSPSDSSGSAESDDRPIKRQRLDSSSTTPALRHGRSMTPIPNDSNQDANIPDIITSLEEPPLSDLDNISIVGDEDESLDEERDDEDESDDPQLSPLQQGNRLRRPYSSRVSSPNGSILDSLGHGTPLRDDLDDLESDQDLQKASRRMPGRRRAPNSDPNLEACLRRQLQLRMGHRAVSKALKPILLELAARSAEQLEAHEDEESFWEIEQQMALELHAYLDARLEILENQIMIATEYHDQQLLRDQEFSRLRFEV